MSDLLTTRQAAAYLGVCRQRVQQLVQDGRLRPRETVHGYRFERSDLDELRRLPRGNPNWRKKG